MLDDLSKNPNRDERRAPESQPAGPMADREVPLPAASPAFDTMHRWLDGEATEQEARRSEGGRYVDLWQRVGEEATERRQLAAPAGLADRIMFALPTETPRAAMADELAPWWRKNVEVSPAVAAAVGAGLVALGLAIGSKLR